MKRFHVWVVCLGLVAGTVCTLSGAKGDAKKGKEVFEPCAICHNADSAEKKVGPGLKGLFKKDKLADGKKATEASIRARIDDGGTGMPGYKELLSDQEKEDLIAYLKIL